MLLAPRSRGVASIGLSFVRYVSAAAHTANAPLELDPSMHDTIRSLSASMDQPLKAQSRTNAANSFVKTAHRELEVLPESTDDVENDMMVESSSVSWNSASAKELRKSPAAWFGSRSIGSVVLPLELHSAIYRLISDLDKHTLHNDAKRLFSQAEDDGIKWNTSYDVEYKSRTQRQRHADRDGAAFVTVAMPSHFAAMTSVLHHVRHRLGDEWKVKHVLDWGAATGSGVWASMLLFQQNETANDTPRMSRSAMHSYINIEKRDSLVHMSKRLLEDVDLGNTSISWQGTFREANKLALSENWGTLAMTAFTLSELSTPLARKQLVKEMWESGAEVMVLIDHGTREGFENIAIARQLLLDMGSKELKETPDEPHRGCHVVAPCSHDKLCPLHLPNEISTLSCTFAQRLQTPDFLRQTKHVKKGHEDTRYSYVALRRGPRPAVPGHIGGRLGSVGLREQMKQGLDLVEMQELGLYADVDPQIPKESDGETESMNAELLRPTSEEVEDEELVLPMPPFEQIEPGLRAEAYHWPRIILPPIKNSGHIIIDGCTAEGKIMRMIIPRSQGKQPYYDARKSSWGDLFPHSPKNGAQERHIPSRAKIPNRSRRGDVEGEGELDQYAGRSGKKSRRQSHDKKSFDASTADTTKHRKRIFKRKDWLTADAGSEFVEP